MLVKDGRGRRAVADIAMTRDPPDVSLIAHLEVRLGLARAEIEAERSLARIGSQKVSTLADLIERYESALATLRTAPSAGASDVGAIRQPTFREAVLSTLEAAGEPLAIGEIERRVAGTKTLPKRGTISVTLSRLKEDGRVGLVQGRRWMLTR